ncbi:MAG: TRAM domain-containing protein [Clostridia bacterium]|nr:TRAM domain-containing protein [Clostridia bacterium]
MFKKISRIAITLLGAGAGFALANILNVELPKLYTEMAFLGAVWFKVATVVTFVLLLGFIAWLLSKPITNGIVKLATRADAWQADKSVSDLFAVIAALILGLGIAYLCGNLTDKIPSKMLSLTVTVIIYLMCPYVCVRIMWKRRDDLPLTAFLRKKDAKKTGLLPCKVLDASVIIDGRIYDVCKTGFLEGKLIVPDFVVNEIMQVADSEDVLKRNRGRRGLDIIRDLQDELKLPVEVREVSYDDVQDYDTKLLRFAIENNAVLVTTDYNLNKAANVRKVRSLNINELTNAVKTTLIPGEELEVRIIKPGKERSQGLAYLDDGTMLVVENGMDRLGEVCRVEVTNVMQTAAGRMIFAKTTEV